MTDIPGEFETPDPMAAIVAPQMARIAANGAGPVQAMPIEVEDLALPVSAVLIPPSPFLPGDFDGDNADYLAFTNCVTGPGEPVTESCRGADLDQDGDADLADLVVLQAHCTGSR